MKVNEIIIEDQVKSYKSVVLTVKRAVDLLNTYCKESLALIHNPIWRGMTNHYQSILTIDPTAGVRESTNTYNYYTQIIDHSPYFDGWPKRSKSLICSSAFQYARGYGGDARTYAIFLYDGVKIAVCPKRDIWETNVRIPEFQVNFVGEVDNLRMFNGWLRNMGLADNWNSLRKAPQIRKVQELCSTYKVDPEQFLPLIMTALSPEKTGFQLLSIAEFAEQKLFNKECWIGGPVVALRKDMYKSFLSAVQK